MLTTLEMNRDMLSDMLSDDYDIVEAANGEEALGILKEQVYNIDLVLLDIIMPAVDGFGVLDVMKRYHWIDNTPVIMISSETSQSYIRKASSNSVLPTILSDRLTALLYVNVFPIRLCSTASRKSC
ncbi:MAG: response regulator [[Eubacterium] siraeum]